ncbi:MAG: phage/plasmid primase, P4 family [Pyrobaculum sp.]
MGSGNGTKGGGNVDGDVKVVELKPVVLSHKEGWFTLGEFYIWLRRVKEKKQRYTRIVVVRNSLVVGKYVVADKLDCSTTQIVVDGVDICEHVAKLVADYENIVEDYEATQRANAASVVYNVTVPRLPSEYELLVAGVANVVTSSTVVKTFVKDGVVFGMFCYRDGYYEECEETLRNTVVTLISKSGLIDARMIPSAVGHVIGYIRDRTLAPYNVAQRCLLFMNKVFCWDMFVKTGDIDTALLDPSPELVVMHRIPWRLNTNLLRQRPGLLRYIPPETVDQLIELFKTLAPNSFAAFLSWVRKPDEDERDAYPRVVLLLEIIGYTLYPHDYPLHKAVLLIGRGSNGKSTYLKLIEKIVGWQNVASVNMTELDPSVNRFAVANLINKLVNISSEPYRSNAFDATRFKELTGEDVVLIDRKNKDPINYRNYAKLIFAANELPRVTEDTYAFWRRWIVLEFPNQFKPDPYFFEKTFKPEEVEAIILLAIYAFRMVLKRGAFTEVSVGAEDVKTEWLSRSIPIYGVVMRMVKDDVIEFDPTSFVVKSDLYALYKAYVDIMRDEGQDVQPISQREFTRYLTQYFPIKSGERRIGGKKKHVYVGVKIKDYSFAKSLVGQLETPHGSL